MRHKNSGRKFNRTSSHRVAMLFNMSISLILNEQIKTTLPKAKDLRQFVEKLITKSKNNTLHARRSLIAKIKNLNAVNKLIGVLSKRYLSRNGGYVRILKSGYRYGDSAEMAYIELVDRDVNEKGKYTLVTGTSGAESSSNQSKEINASEIAIGDVK